VTDWQEWHDHYADPTSSLARRLGVVQHLLTDLVDDLTAGQRILGLCAGDGRDIIPVLAKRPAEQRPQLVLVELDPPLTSAARGRAADAGVGATVIVGDAGLRSTWFDHLPVDLLMLCGIFGNVTDDDVQTTISSAPAMLTPDGAVIWTRGAFRDRDLRPQVRQWFKEAGFQETAYEAEPAGYGIGVNRMTERVVRLPIPSQLFTFNR
jgi:hypothetical protein